MTCVPLRKFDLSGSLDGGPKNTLNPSPVKHREKSLPPKDRLLCSPKALPPLPTHTASTGRLALHPLFAKPVLHGLGTPTAPMSLPPPPREEFSLLLYEILTQLKDFKLEATLDLPVLRKAGAKKAVKTHTRILLGKQGRLKAAELKFNPYWGPITFPNPVAQVVQHMPIFGIFAYYQILSLKMNPATRRIAGEVQYLLIPMEQDLHDEVLGKGHLSPQVLRGPGYDLRTGLPEYSWQLSDFLEKAGKSRPPEEVSGLGDTSTWGEMLPLFRKGRVNITGDFSNRKIRIGPLTLHFQPKKPGQEQRVSILGGLTHPKLKIWGLQSLEIKHPNGILRLGHLDEQAVPLEAVCHLNFQDWERSQLQIENFDSKGFKIENLSPDPEKNLKFTLKKGFALKNLWMGLSDDGPSISLQELTARQGELEGMGIRFRTSPGDRAVFRELKVKVKDGYPYFFGKISGNATGSLEYRKKGEELAWLEFKDLKGEGLLNTGLDREKKAFLQLWGNFSTEIPDLRLLVRSPQLQGWVRTEIGDAKVTGNSVLTVWPQDRRAKILTLPDHDPIKVRGSSGVVQIHQDTSMVAGWENLPKNLGPLARKIATDLNIQVKKIGFDVHQMDIRRTPPEVGQKPTLEILDAKIGNILVKGDLFGNLWTRLPGGFIHPIMIPEQAKMIDAMVRIEELRDFETDGRRQAVFRSIFIDGEESRPTLNSRDQKRCGFDRQQVHAELGLFGFIPDNKEIQIEHLGKSFQIYLKNPAYLGGCLKID